MPWFAWVSFAGTAAKTEVSPNLPLPDHHRDLHAPHFFNLAMSDRSRYYVVGAFLLGVVLTFAYSKRPSPAGCGDASVQQHLKQQQSLLSIFAKFNVAGTLKKSLLDIESSLGAGGGNIKEGIEGCIGDTPLIRIKSLSDYTGCDILAKAEVGSMAVIDNFSTNVIFSSFSTERAIALKTGWLSASSKWYVTVVLEERPTTRDFC